MLDVIIANTGMGIKKHLARHPRYHGLANDAEAIKIALAPNVTGIYISNEQDGGMMDPNRSENQGLGLSVTDLLVKRSGNGVLCIWSGNGLYQSGSGISIMPVAWPGTVVFLRLVQEIQVDYLKIIKELHVPLRRPKHRLYFS
ncbi:MAG: hypothetical protein LBD30_00355 [Verrucomicrobiales bacterium]|jgi:hypothetical protein|nr:hypothetical protein [Verrucomicrobiales bacterium]